MKFIYTVLLAILVLPSIAQSESEYIRHLNEHFRGTVEYAVTNGRVDILTEHYAIEVERAYKWKHSIGQALWYGLQTNRRSAIVLIVTDPSEYKYFQMLNSSLAHAGLDERIKVWIYPQDFPYLSKLNTSTNESLSTDRPTATGSYWMTASSNKRHNDSCRFFKNTNGKICGPEEGTACLRCGG